MTLDQIRARTAERKAAGANQVYPEHVNKPRALPCVHEGDVVEPCRSCAGAEGRHVRECDRHGRCTRTEAKKGVAACEKCPDYAPDPSLLPKP